MLKILLIPLLLLSSALYAEGGDDVLIYDSSGGSITSTSNALNNFVTNFPATQAVTQSTSPWVISGNLTNITGSISLPTGASTSALQSSGNTSLSSIDGKTPALGQAVMASSVPVVLASNQTAIAVSQSGTWTTGRTWTLSSGSDSVSASVSNFPATQSVTQGTSPWVVSGTVTANAGTGTFQTNVTNASIPVTQLGSWAVTANAGTNLNTSALALDTSVNGILAAQNSTTSGQKGPLIQGSVTTAAPTYTTGNTSPLSLTTAAALRVDASATTQPISGTVTANQGGAPWAENITQIGGTAIALGQSVMSSSLPVVLSSNQTGINAFLDKSTSGSIAALNAAVSLATNGMSSTTFTVSGTWVGTLVFEGFDGANWISTPGLTQPAGGITAAIVSNGTVLVNNGGYQQMRVRASVYTSGTATVQMNAGAGIGLVEVYNDSGDPLVIKGNGVAGTPDANVVTIQGIANGTNVPVAAVPLDGTKATYSAGVSNLVLANGATDFFIINGSATKTIRITSISFGATTTSGSGASANLSLVKRSTANSGGTSTAQTATPHDANSAAGTATVLAYTANPTTTGTLAGTVRSFRYSVSSSNTMIPVKWDFGVRPSQAIVLRGVAQSLALNLNSASITGSIADVDIEWTEE